MSERFALLFSDGSILMLPAGTGIEQARKEALSCDENEGDPKNFTSLIRVAVRVVDTIDVPSGASEQTLTGSVVNWPPCSGSTKQVPKKHSRQRKSEAIASDRQEVLEPVHLLPSR